MQPSLKKAQRNSIDRLCACIRVIEELVPLEQKRFSKQRKRHLESAHVTLRRHAYTFDLSLPMLSTFYQPKQYLEHAHLVAQALADRFASEWQRCEKVTPTRARQLTQADFEARSGIIETREGPAPFTVEDYLALDDQGEYPIQQSAIERCYVQIALPDEQGFALYRSTEIREACQRFSAFATDRGVAGLAGDYLMCGGDKRTWPCAKAKFEQEYRFVENAGMTLDDLLALKAKAKHPLTYCLCGSTGRATQAFGSESLRLTLAGHKVLSIGVNAKDSDLGITEEQKVQLDILHLFKIDDADVVRVLNVGGYMGESTRRELEYARRLGKRIEFLEEHNP